METEIDREREEERGERAKERVRGNATKTET